jgi:hypothetical protein
MVKPISLRLRNAEILADAHATLVRAGREKEMRQAHNRRVLERARNIAAQAKEQDRQRRVAKLNALKALAAVRDCYANLIGSTTCATDHERYRERQEAIEREMREIVTRTSR